MAPKNEGIYFTVAEITDARTRIEEALRDGEAGVREMRRFLDTTLQSICAIRDMAAEKLSDLAREIADMQEELTDIISEMAGMAGVGGMGSAPMFQNPNAPYRGGHNYHMASSQLAQHDALFGTPSAAYEKLRDEQRFKERELAALEERKMRLEQAEAECKEYLSALYAMRDENTDAYLAPLYHARDVASEAESLGAAAAKEMGRLIGKSGSCHTLRISAEGTQAFGTAAKGLRQAAEKMCESAGELERKMRLHRRAIQKSPTMDAAEREALDGTHAAYAGAEVLTARAQSLDRLAGRLAEYQALRGKI